MKVSFEEGCAICGSTWGNYWAEIDGDKMFFCCEICYLQFQNMVNEVKKKTGWDRIDEIKIQGDYRGRECTANQKDKSFKYLVTFNSSGAIQKFKELN